MVKSGRKAELPEWCKILDELEKDGRRNRNRTKRSNTSLPEE